MTERAPRLMPLYQLFMLALCVLALAGIVLQILHFEASSIQSPPKGASSLRSS